MTEPTRLVFDFKKLWKLLLVASPALISSSASYLKSRAEATDQAKAGYEALRSALTQLQADSKSCHDDALVLRGEVNVLKEQAVKATAPSLLRPLPPPAPLLPLRPLPPLPLASSPQISVGAREPSMLFGLSLPSEGGSGGAGGSEAPFAATGLGQRRPQMQLPVDFDSVVERYKSKK